MMGLKGIVDMHLFRFYVDDKGWPVMQYKKSSTDVDWLHKVNPIKMWKEDAKGTPNCRLANPSLYNQIPYGVALFLLQPPHLTIPKGHFQTQGRQRTQIPHSQGPTKIHRFLENRHVPQ